MGDKHKLFTLSVVAALLSSGTPGPDPAGGWKRLAPGMELRRITARNPSAAGDSQITVLRMDPGKWELAFAGISQSGEASGHTARDWCEKSGFVAAINAGMFDTDYKTHTGYLQAGSHVNSGHVSAYKSAAAFSPRNPKSPPFRIFDLDAPGVTVQSILKDYASVVQNLRLVKRPGVNSWGRQNKKWSEAALGEDDTGRILFIFSRSPFSMHDLNEELLAAGIGLVAAQHLDGGPEAQLYVHAGDTELEMFGSYETSFQENDQNAKAWPVPNVLGIRQKK